MGDDGRLLGESAVMVDDQDGVDGAEIVQRLRDILGARLTAYIAGVKETRIVRTWADGTEAPSLEVSQRLRLAYRIAAEIAQHEGKQVTQAWFVGMNPGLRDMAPARIMRNDDSALSAAELVRAARRFVAGA